MKILNGCSFSLLLSLFTALVAAGPALALPQISWAEMIATGDNHMARKEYPLAEECYEQALLQVKKSPHDTDDLVKCMEKVAAALQIQDITEDATPLFRKSLKLLERARGKDSPELVPTLYALGVIYETEGERKKAIVTYTRALAINRKSFSPDSLNVADSLHRLARAQVSANLLQPAESLYLQSLTLYMHQPDLPSTSGLENLLSDYLDLLKKLDLPTKIIASDFQAQLLKDRVGSQNVNMGVPQSFWQKQVSALLTNSRAGAARLDNSSASPDALTSTNSANSTTSATSATSATSTSLTTDNSVTNPANPANTASIPELTNSSALKEFGRNEVDFYERMVAIDLKSLGQNHPTVADDLTALASIYVSQHRYSDAKPLLKRALSIYDNVYGPNNLLVTRTRTALVQVTRQIEHPELVASVYTDPSELANIPSSAKNLEISFKLNDLAFLCYCQGKIDNAINIYHWALAATAGATGKQSTLSAACMTDFATALRSTSDASESQKMMDSASGILTNSESAKNSRLY